ncbi:hypothetical protein JHK85_055739 [Glycine max]|nr:hypothetical protein JHK85_055739 [Glycine max]
MESSAACPLHEILEMVRPLSDPYGSASVGTVIVHDNIKFNLTLATGLDCEDILSVKCFKTHLPSKASNYIFTIGYGTVASRLPSKAAGQDTDTERLNKLTTFQRKALQHALLFPAVERIVYSTCSINQIENDDVIKSVLPIAESNGFQLAKPFSEWQCRGLPVFEGSECLVRTDPAKHGEGFFIALFTRKDANFSGGPNKNETRISHSTTKLKTREERRNAYRLLALTYSKCG